MIEIWMKRIAPEDEDLWEGRLIALVGERFVILRRVGRSRLEIQVFLENVAEGEALKERFGGRLDSLPEQNWMAMAAPKPILVKVRDRLLVTSDTDPDSLMALRAQYPDRLVLTIPPELAFGTGDHETTSTCLRMLVDVAAQRGKREASWRLLDLGTGTGILALAAKGLGAESVHGWENDPLALTAAENNVRMNGYDPDKVVLTSRDVFDWEPEHPSWDVITANMFSEILIALFPKIRRALKPDGTLIISGILHDQAEDTVAAAVRAGLEMDCVKQVGKWVTARTG